MRKSKFLLRLTERECELFDEYCSYLTEELDISTKRLSEIIFYGFKQYAEQLMNSKITGYTNTNTQGIRASREEFIEEFIKDIQRKGAVSYKKILSSIFTISDLFNSLNIRTKSKWCARIFTDENLAILPVNYYVNQIGGIKQLSAFYFIHKKSKWYPQLRDLTISTDRIKFNQVCSLDGDTRERSYYQKVYKCFSNMVKHVKDLDRAERVMLSRFMHEISPEEFPEKPLIDNSDWNMAQVISLRSEYKFREADEIFREERQKREETTQVKNTSGVEDDLRVLDVHAGGS